MDSRQVYRGMDIGTDKVPLVQRAQVPHHGLDLIDPDRTYSAGQFARHARMRITDIRGRGRVPVIAGGTGFFLRALLDPIFHEPEMDPERLERLRGFLNVQDKSDLATWVRRFDPDRAEMAVQGGGQRMTRVLEVALLTGRPLSWWHLNAEAEAPGMDGVVIVLTVPREELDRRINRRVDRMVECGLVDEVRTLLAAGYGPTDPGMTGTGYREVAGGLAGEWSMDEAFEVMKLRTRQYARRQLTWFRHQLPDHAVWLDASQPLDVQVERVLVNWTEALE